MKSRVVFGDWQPIQHGMKDHAAQQGMTLMEWLLSLMIGLMLSLAAMQTLVTQQQLTARLAKLSKAKAELRSALMLIRAESLMADRIEWRNGMWAQSMCPLSGRRIVLQFIYPTASVTYSVGQPPSGIWRNEVLMRCGPAYGLEGSLGSGLSQNRVYLDGIKDFVVHLGNFDRDPGLLELSSSIDTAAGDMDSLQSNVTLPVRQ